MANTLEADIIRILTDTRDKIRANMEAKKINASGRTSESIRVEPYPGGVKLVGGYNGGDTAPIPTLEFGRGAGNVPGGFIGICQTGSFRGKPDISNTFKYIILQWAKNKGLDFDWAGATGLARKIAYIGTDRHANNVDVYSTPVMEAKDRINQILQDTVSRTVRAALGGANVTSIKGAFTE